MGGIVGDMETAVYIINCRAALNVKLTTTGTSTLYLGGVAGCIGTAVGGVKGTGYISGVEASGNVEASGTGNVYVGGMVGLSRTKGTMEDVRVSGEVKMSQAAGGSAYTGYCGGIIAHMAEGDLTRCDFAGKLILPVSYASAGDTYIGGLAASVGSDANTASITIEECDVEGDIDVTENGYAGLDFGGVAGRVEGSSDGNKITFQDCEYRNGTITVVKKNRLWGGTYKVVGAHFGGFAGDVVVNAEFKNCRVLAREIRATLHSGNVGGFTALVRSHMSGCYTDTPLNVTFTGQADNSGAYAGAGGFAAYYTDNQGTAPSGGWVIENCYARGPVTVSANQRGFYAGGFVAMIGTTEMAESPINANIRNCYALGNVTADRTGGTGDVRAGGFVGYMNLKSGNTVEHCFSAGAVLAKGLGSGAVYSGGFVGYRESGGSLKNCAALGGGVTAQGGSSRKAARVYAYPASGGGANNYALKTMAIEEDSDYCKYDPDPRPVDPDLTKPDGADAAASAFRTSGFWTTLGFDGDDWDFSNVINRGFPTLVNVEG
jgi:hypothetical protein